MSRYAASAPSRLGTNMLDFLIELSRWYNLLFVLPVLTILIYQLLHTLAILDIGGIDAAFGDIGAVAADRLSQSKGKRLTTYLLTLLKIDQIPPLLVVVTFVVSWGLVGIVCNHWFVPLFANFTPAAVVLSAFIAVVLASLLTYLISQATALLFPTANMTLRRAELVGTTATVISGEVSTAFGRARIDNLPYSVTIFCQIDQGDEPIKRGEKAVIWEYNPKTHRYRVQRFGNEN